LGIGSIGDLLGVLLQKGYVGVKEEEMWKEHMPVVVIMGGVSVFFSSGSYLFI